MADAQGPEAPQTLEGYYILHDVYRIDWPMWWAVQGKSGYEIAESARQWLAQAAGVERGDTAAYSILGQKGDLMLVHYRATAEDLNRAEMSFRRLALFEFMQPVYSYLSIIELGLYELTSVAARRMAEQNLAPGTPEYAAAFAAEMEQQKQRVQTRLFRKIPEQKYICFYPMNKRRGEQVNWYNLTMDERRDLMRGHGRIGHKYHEQVTQIIGGSVGLDDWEWGVSLHADDPLQFKKLVYEMRFDPASALYAEFGPFYVGLRLPPEGLPQYLAGKWP
ncbi:MAG: heme-dependent peroxidase [Planctomycetes bacterium]|nr:heme-dependent peroxidase [Planctomycetota bacterium]